MFVAVIIFLNSCENKKGTDSTNEIPGIIPIESIIGMSINEESKVILEFTKNLLHGLYLILKFFLALKNQKVHFMNVFAS